MRVAVVCPAYPPVPGGVSDQTARWAQAMVDHAGAEVVVRTGPGAQGPTTGPLRVLPGRSAWGLAAVDDVVAEVRALAADVVKVEYVPHLYERRGLSLGIAQAVRKLGRAGVPVVVHAHELYFGRHEALRHQPIGLVQRLALRPLFRGARKVVFTTPDRQARMAAVFPEHAGRFATLPIGPNLWPPADADPAAWRAAHDIGPDELVLLVQGGAHPSKELGSVRAALEGAGVAFRLVQIGGAAIAHPRAVALGHLEPDAAGEVLAAADLALAPFDDGASGRRSSVVNALAAGLATVSTRGTNTDPTLFRPSAIRLVAPGDPAAFAAAVVELAGDPAARSAMGAAAKALHDERFAWPVLARAWAPLLVAAAAP